MFFLVAATASSRADSPYVGQEFRPIKALSEGDIPGYLTGNGMGLAKAAELNGYPGPAHALELASELVLTSRQTEQTEALFQAMKSRAVPLGEKLVEEERALNELFVTRSVTPQSLAGALARISRVRGEGDIRRVHPEAHLEQTAILSPALVEAYVELRGYAAAGKHHHPGMKHHGAN